MIPRKSTVTGNLNFPQPSRTDPSDLEAQCRISLLAGQPRPGQAGYGKLLDENRRGGELAGFERGRARFTFVFTGFLEVRRCKSWTFAI